ncbi:TPA: Bbp16 family capsid cement protein [Klebsiella pneumoniae]
MLLDQQALFSAAQAITATAASTNVIDTGSNKDVGKYGDIPLLIQVVEGFNNLTSLTVTVQTDDNSTFSSAADVLSMTIPLASLVLGYKSPVITLPMKMERYIRLNYTVTGTAPTTGKVTAGIAGGVQTNA